MKGKWVSSGLVVAALSALWLSTGCVSGDAPSVGGETHWLEACDSDAECGSELSCACGICTVECNSDSSCDAVGEGGRCVSSADAKLELDCESSAPAKVCAASGPPDDTDDGAGTGDELSDGSEDTSDSSVPTMSDETTSEETTTQTDAGGPNTVILQGARYDLEGQCFGPSETAGTLASEGPISCDDALTYALDPGGNCWLFPDSCIPDDFTAVGSSEMGPIFFECTETEASCPDSPPSDACPEALLSSDGDCVSCGEARARADAALSALAMEETLLQCELDTDCTLASTETLCGGTCGAIASVATQDKFAQRVADISEQYCSDPNFQALCGFSTPECEQAVYSCQDGRCVQGVKPACVARGGCDSPLTCFAETCAANCTSSADCAEEERCVFEEAEGCLLGVVDPSAAMAGVCLTQCRADADCDSVGDGMFCWSNYCVAEAPACELACPKVASECGESCNSITARAYRPEANCRDAEGQVLGCVPMGRGSTDDDTCVVSPEGLVFDGLSGTYSAQLVANGGYVSCTQEQIDAANAALACE